MNKFRQLLIVLFLVFTAFKSDKPAYSLFNKEGKPVKYEKMLRDLQRADIVLFGELHDNPIAHWLQLGKGNTGIADFTICIDKNITRTK